MTQQVFTKEKAGSEEYQEKTQKDDSLAFKLKVIDAVEKGKLTYKHTQLRYSIKAEVRF